MIVLQHALFNEGHFVPEEGGVLLGQPIQSQLCDREIIVQTMFEQFNMRKLHFASSSALCLYAAGQTTGIVLDSGDGLTQVIPVVDGVVQQHAVAKANLGGRDLTRHLLDFLPKRVIGSLDLHGQK